MALALYEEPIANWKLDALDNILSQFENQIPVIIERYDIKEACDYVNILLHMSGKVIVTTREILTLCAAGYPDGAMGLARNLYEQFIVLLYFQTLKRNDTEEFARTVSDFWLSYRISILNRGELCRADFLDQNKDTIKNRRCELKKMKQHTEGSRDYWWAGRYSFHDLKEYVENSCKDDKILSAILPGLHHNYKLACDILHVSALGNCLRIKKDLSLGIIDTTPTFEELGIPLIFTVYSLIGITCIICDYFGLQHSYYRDELNKLAEYYGSENKKHEQ